MMNEKMGTAVYTVARAVSLPDFTPFCNPNFTYARYLLAQNIIRLKKHSLIYALE